MTLVTSRTVLAEPASHRILAHKPRRFYSVAAAGIAIASIGTAAVVLLSRPAAAPQTPPAARAALNVVPRTHDDRAVSAPVRPLDVSLRVRDDWMFTSTRPSLDLSARTHDHWQLESAHPAISAQP